MKNWCFWIVVLERRLSRVPWTTRRSNPSINPKGYQLWIFIGRTDAEAEAPILWPPDANNWLIRKAPDAWKIEGKRRRGLQRTRWLDGITNYWTLLKLMFIELVMPSKGLILCRPLLLRSIFPSNRVFSNESVLHIRWPKYWHFSFSNSPSNEY